MAAIHSAVETKRGSHIPDWAYRDVLFMLIDYSIRSFELMERRLSTTEKQQVFDVFHRVGVRMELKGLPDTYHEWEIMRQEHLQNDMQHSHYTDDLFAQYRKHLGGLRYGILVESQILVIPVSVRKMLGFRNSSFMAPLIGLYLLGRRMKLDWLLKALILPAKYKDQIKELDYIPAPNYKL